MNAHHHFARPSSQIRAQWPETVLPADPDTMHPRAVEMAQAMREGHSSFRQLIGEGFTCSEITEHFKEAQALAQALSVKQVLPGADLPSEMIEKAKAAIQNQPPKHKGTTESQASYLAWSRYCEARNALVIDNWPGQRQRCMDLLEAYFRTTTAGPAITNYVLCAIRPTLETRH